ncbi:SRPBCC family protein [Actinocrispum sp. NPDC049592]|uniref:SRPBCC family protein n=1 Tax=Actinocrispum sp. NPDC049592 TaxID=3154835 RepID=UPI0034238AFB
MYEIRSSSVIRASVENVWSVVTDVANWPSWDPHEQAARLDGPFEVGAVGWSKPNGGPATDWTITDVVPLSRWASECALPGGKITGVNTFEPIGDGQVRCTKTVRVTGPLVPLFRVYFGRKMRKDMQKTWKALESRVA